MSHACPHCRLHRSIQMTPTCWLWKGSRYTKFGLPTYGQFMLDGVRMGAHRASYLLHVGPVPDGLDLMHSCDVKECVNPAHLRPGTRSENLYEAVERRGGWGPRGETHWHARLTWTEVRAIRAAYAAGERPTPLARRYGVSPSHIQMIVKGLRWREQVA